MTRFAGSSWLEQLAREASGRIVAQLAGPDWGGILYDALADPAFCKALLDAIAQGRTLETRSGLVRAFPTGACTLALLASSAIGSKSFSTSYYSE